jgi:phospholipase C
MIPALPVQAESQEGGDHAGTPIKHVVVIYQENVSFDHYFGTYPNALNPPGEPAFHAQPGTPRVAGLSQALLTNNPNLSNPQRLDRSQNSTCDENHNYTAEQSAFDNLKMDQFVQFASNGAAKTALQCTGQQTAANDYAVMDYYDGNTVTALWNYAQRFAMSDHAFSTGFGPSTPGAINLVAGNTYGAACTTPAVYCATGTTTGTITGDPQPTGDICDTRDNTTMKTGTNVGDLLNARNVTWGFFQGGFSNCAQTHPYVDQHGVTHTQVDYIPHHEPFQYYASTANPAHLPPSSTAMIGHQDQANHQYDLTSFWSAVDAGGMPAVSFLKAAGYQDGHAGYSSPLAEQRFLVETLNKLQQRPEWESTAVFIAYDDSDGWYDHLAGPISYASQTPLDTLNGPGVCGEAEDVPSAGGVAQQARCGNGPRQPFLLISPFAKTNFVDHHVTNQSSVLKFIEDNWHLGRIGGGSSDATAGSLDHLFNFERGNTRPLLLDPSTGERI